jgi:hypothetical protein
MMGGSVPSFLFGPLCPRCFQPISTAELTAYGKHEDCYINGLLERSVITAFVEQTKALPGTIGARNYPQ